MQCSSCGAQNDDGRSRCVACGKGLEDALAATLAAPPAAPLPDEELSGRLVAHYQVGPRLGAGGMGVVYRAVDARLRRPVALKVISPQLAGDAQARARFLREAQAASALDHPHIGTVYDVGEERGRLWLAIAFYDGETLAARIARGPLPVDEAVRILRQLASGLGAAHEAGIVHRDVKPGNVMLTRDGVVKILDFGLAKLHREGEDGAAEPLTRSGELLGTVAYMAPEQLTSGTVDRRTDLWALGVIAYEVLSGVRPFQGTTAVSLGARILDDEPMDLIERRRDLPPHLARLVAQLLAKPPGERPGTAAEVIAALDGEAPGRRAARPSRRRRALLVAVALGPLLGGPALWLARGRLGPAADGRRLVVDGGEARRRAVAVLGFRNLSGRPDAAWLSTALGEMLASELAAGDRLRLLPAESVERVRRELHLGEPDSLSEATLVRIRRGLGSDLVLFGAYLASGPGGDGGLRLDLHLQDTTVGELVITLSEQGSAAELDQLVSRIGIKLRERLGLPAPSPSESASARRAHPSRLEAERRYAEGLARLRVYDYRGAARLLEQAVAAEPDHPLPHSALAEVYFQLSADDKARAEGRRAFELAGSLGEDDRLLVEARYRRVAREYRRAVEVLDRLCRRHPDDLDLGLAQVLAQDVAGDAEAALATVARLRRLPAPLRDDPRLDLAEARAEPGDERRRAALAAQGAEKARAIGATVIVAYARRLEGWAHLRLGESEAALQAAEEARLLFQSAAVPWGIADTLLLVAMVAEQRGDVAGAERGLRQRLAFAVEQGEPQARIETLHRLGELLAHQGRFAEADELVGDAQRLAVEAGDRRQIAAGRRFQGLLAERRGDLAAATRTAADALRLDAELGVAQPASGRPATELLLCRIDLAAGRGADAGRRLQALLPWAESHAVEWRPGLHRALSLLALDEGRFAEAAAEARQARAAERGSTPLERAENRLLEARALRGQDPAADVAALVDEAAALARQGGDADRRLRVATELARFDGGPGAAERLGEIAAEAERRGLVGEALGARLVLAEVGGSPRGEALRSLAEQAAARGHGRLVRLARQAAAAPPSRPAATDGGPPPAPAPPPALAPPPLPGARG